MIAYVLIELLQYVCAAGAMAHIKMPSKRSYGPQVDGEAESQAFLATLHRLRKRLRYDDVIQVSDSRVSLHLSAVP
jgi:hypothetical protein